MADSTLNRFVARGTAAERAAFTPDPPTPSSGPDPLHIWYETDTGNTYGWDGSAWDQINTASSVADGDKGDISISGGVWSIDAGVVTYAKMQDVSATDRLLGRVSAGSGDVEEVVLDTDDTLAADSDDRVPTQQAVKAYVDANAGGSGYINSYTGSAASEADIPLPSGYHQIELVVYITFSNDGVQLNGRVTTDNFSTVKSGASDYKYDSWRGNNGGNANSSSSGAAQMQLATNVGSAAGDDMSGSIRVYFHADSGKLTLLNKNLTYGIGGAASSGIEIGGGVYLTAETVNGIRLYPSAGTITYAVHVYGLPTS